MAQKRNAASASQARKMGSKDKTYSRYRLQLSLMKSNQQRQRAHPIRLHHLSGLDR